MDIYHPDMMNWVERMQEQRHQTERAQASHSNQAAAQRANALYDEMQKMGDRLTGAGA